MAVTDRFNLEVDEVNLDLSNLEFDVEVPDEVAITMEALRDSIPPAVLNEHNYRRSAILLYDKVAWEGISFITGTRRVE